MKTAVSRSRITSVLLAVFGLMALAKIKPPNEWAQTHYLFSYDLGLSRRAFVGETLQWLGFEAVTNAQAHVVAILVTLMGGLALTLWVARHVPQTQAGLALGLTIVTSFGFAVYLGNTGYLDGLLIVLAMAALMIPGTGIGAVLAKCVLCCVGVLIHEAMAGTLAVLVGAQLWLSGARILAPMPVIASGLVAAVLLLTSPFADIALAEVTTALSDRAPDFNARSIAIEAVMRFRDGMEPSFLSFWDGPNHFFERTFVLPIGVIYLAIWLFLTRKLIPHRPPLDQLALAVSMLGPLAILLIAYDLSRFIGLIILQGACLLIVLTQRDSTAQERFHETFTPMVFVGFLVANVLIALPPLNPVPSFYDQLPGAVLDFEEWSD